MCSIGSAVAQSGFSTFSNSREERGDGANIEGKKVKERGDHL